MGPGSAPTGDSKFNQRLIISLAVILAALALFFGSLAIRRVPQEKAPPPAAKKPPTESAPPPSPPQPRFSGEKMAPTPVVTREQIAQGMNRTGVRQWLVHLGSTYTNEGRDDAINVDLTFVSRYGQAAIDVFHEAIAEQKDPGFRAVLEALLPKLEKQIQCQSMPRSPEQIAKDQFRDQLRTWMIGFWRTYDDEGLEGALKKDLTLLLNHSQDARDLLREDLAKQKDPDIRSALEALLQKLDKKE